MTDENNLLAGPDWSHFAGALWEAEVPRHQYRLAGGAHIHPVHYSRHFVDQLASWRVLAG